MEHSMDMQSTAETSCPSKEELGAAGKVLAGLLLARKNSSLYPEGHSICIHSLEQFYTLLDSYLSSHGSLRLDVEKDRLVFMGESIYSTEQREGELPFTLFRDGILWLEFTDGIGQEEVTGFLKVITTFSTLGDEPEGDIVTSLWELQFPHIRYEVADFFLETDQDAGIDLSAKTQKEESSELREENLKDMAVLDDPPINLDELVLTPEEQRALGDMVIMEENQDPTAYLDALSDSLIQYQKKEDSEVILDVFTDEFQAAIMRKDFNAALKILQSLNYVRDNCVVDAPWANSLIEDFFFRISSPLMLKPLQTIWRHIDSGQADSIRQILVCLRPEAVHTLGELLLLNPSVQLQKLLMKVLFYFSLQDIRPLEALLDHQNEELVQRLVTVLMNLKDDRSLSALMKLIRHPSLKVRQEALRGLLKRDPTRIKDMFHLINDKDEAIRDMILMNMSQSRNHTAEKLLRNHLEKLEARKPDSSHVIACFEALGKCGSQQSIEFLSRILLGQGLLSGLKISAYHEGAALALSRLKIKEASQVLEKAAKSLYPGIRALARKVLNEREPSGGAQ